MSTQTNLSTIAGLISKRWEADEVAQVSETDHSFQWESEVEDLEEESAVVSFTVSLGGYAPITATLRDGEFELVHMGDDPQSGMFGTIHPGLLEEAERVGCETISFAQDDRRIALQHAQDEHEAFRSAGDR